KLITQLGDKNFEVREDASRRLEAFGLQALEALREAASAAKDAEIRKRAGNLVAAIEKAHEMEIEFAWFDSLGFPDLAKCKFVQVSTGRNYRVFLVRDDGLRCTVLD